MSALFAASRVELKRTMDASDEMNSSFDGGNDVDRGKCQRPKFSCKGAGLTSIKVTY
jgi:hypothetical protein